MRSATVTPATELVSWRLLLQGHVQGIGVRPAVARLAQGCGVGGMIRNISAGVEIEVEGTADSVQDFLSQLPAKIPKGARIWQATGGPIAKPHRQQFVIEPSSEPGPVAVSVPADRVVCAACLAEVRRIGDHRQDYAFTGCTDCGPRYSFIERMPYDRLASGMRSFDQCPRCNNEYHSPEDRRFHAQSNCCPSCGPRLWASDAGNRHIAAGMGAVEAASAALIAGRIVALKGIGGYQLLADATNSAAVRRLRTRKRRAAKPLAVMVGDVRAAERIAQIHAAEQRWLEDAANPIVLLRKKDTSLLAKEVSFDLNTVGVMLPTSPLHALLMDRAGRPLIATSGNRDGEPLAYDEQSAERELSGVADLWLHHDRPILRPIDDSVLRVIDGRPCVLRLARGLAPKVLQLPFRLREESVVAVGGEQKGAIALCNGHQAVLGPHVGDLTGAANCERWAVQLRSLLRLYGVEAPRWVYDAHPDYFSTRFAQRQPGDRLAVQHHHAHIAAALLEHGRTDQPVLGIAWDGAGYGPDGTTWGGECLWATLTQYRRVAFLRPFQLPGGDAAVRQPWRVALALLHDTADAAAWRLVNWPEVSTWEIESIVEVLNRPHLSPLTSSMGRLFDGVAALVLGVTQSEFEGQPAMQLESACDRQADGAYPLPWNRSDGQIDWRPLVAKIVQERSQRVATGTIAMRFHRSLANLIAELSDDFSALSLVTCGGVFQNAVLVELVAERIGKRGAGWLPAMEIPPGDGGLAVGQLAVAMAHWKDH